MQEVQLRARIAICDTMIAYNYAMAARQAGETRGGGGGAPEASGTAKSELSSCAALFDDMVGDDNALAAECRFCLGLWGVVEGLDGDEGDAAALRSNLRRQLGLMAEAFPSGRHHFVVAGLARLYELRFGAMEWPESDEGAAEGGAAAAEGSARTHVEAARGGAAAAS